MRVDLVASVSGELRSLDSRCHGCLHLGLALISDYRLFTFRPEAARAATAGNSRLEQLLDEITAGMNDKMNLPLTQLFNPSSIGNAVPGITST